MPRYYFNTRIGDELISDPDGEVLVDPDRAWEMARAMIRELLKTEGTGGALLNATIEVTDDDGRDRAGVSLLRGGPRRARSLHHPALTALRRRHGATPLAQVYSGARAVFRQSCFRLRIGGKISESGGRKATGAGIMLACARNKASARENTP